MTTLSYWFKKTYINLKIDALKQQKKLCRKYYKKFEKLAKGKIDKVIISGYGMVALDYPQYLKFVSKKKWEQTPLDDIIDFCKENDIVQEYDEVNGYYVYRKIERK